MTLSVVSLYIDVLRVIKHEQGHGMRLCRLEICAADWLVRSKTFRPIRNASAICAQPIRMRKNENNTDWVRRHDGTWGFITLWYCSFQLRVDEGRLEWRPRLKRNKGFAGWTLRNCVCFVRWQREVKWCALFAGRCLASELARNLEVVSLLGCNAHFIYLFFS